MGNLCGGNGKKDVSKNGSGQHQRDFKGESILKAMNAADLKEDPTTSREPISKIYTLGKVIGKYNIK